MITFDEICKSYGRLNVLESVSLSITSGKVTAIAGPNGSGKTTLIKILLGLVKPGSGTMSLNGKILNGDYTYRNDIGYMPQASHFPDNLRVREILTFVRKLRNCSAVQDSRLIDLFSLGGEMDKRIQDLSGGTRQKLNATIALMFGPDILILDEPTAGLDPLASHKLKNEIRSAREAGTTVIVTTHIISEIEELAQDLVFLCEKKIRFAGSVELLKETTGKEKVEDALASLMENGNK